MDWGCDFKWPMEIIGFLAWKEKSLMHPKVQRVVIEITYRVPLRNALQKPRMYR